MTLRPYAFVLAVPNLHASAAWFRDVLGFRLLWEEGEDWRLAERDGVRLMLGHCPNEPRPPEIGSHSWFGYIDTDDVAALHAEFTQRGAHCTAPLDQPYGMRELMVTTLDGHRIVFGQQRPA